MKEKSRNKLWKEHLQLHASSQFTKIYSFHRDLFDSDNILDEECGMRTGKWKDEQLME